MSAEEISGLGVILAYAALFPFDFEGRMWWAKFDGSVIANKRTELVKNGMDPDEAEELATREAADVVEIANCVPTALYFQANPVTDESWYYFRIDFPHDGASIKNTFTGGTLAGGAEFKKRLLSIAPGAVWTGSTGQLDRLMKVQLAAIKTVETIDFIGYSKEHRAYILGDYAVKDGVVHSQNDEDFFDLGKLSLKSIGRSVSLDVTPPDADGLNTAWVDLIWKCYGAKGVVALAFWFGSLFAEQVREAEKSFPFLEIVGDPGAGKSTLVEFLWKLFGRPDYEGFDPSKSTAAARARNFAQVANMPVVLIESDRGDDVANSKKFDWDELKTAYNGRSVRSTGVKNGGNETREPPFRGAIVITQNFTVQASDAVLQRICHLHFTVKGHTRETKEAAQTLERTPVEDVSGFLIAAVKAEAKVLATFRERYGVHEADIQRDPLVKSQRLAKNHAQLCAMVDALEHVVSLGEEAPIETRRDFPALNRSWQNTDAFRTTRPKTQQGYAYHAGLIGDWSEASGHPKVSGLSREKIEEFLALYDDRPTTKRHLKIVLKMLLDRAVDLKWIAENPAAKIKVKAPKTKVAIWEQSDVDHYAWAAAVVGHPALAAMIVTGWEIGQRVTDLRMFRLGAAYSDNEAAFRFSQSKTDSYVTIPVSDYCASLIRACRVPDTLYLFINPDTGRPYEETRLGHLFQRIRRLAKGRSLTLRALRHSCVVQLARSGCTVPEIAAITGHSPASVEQILRLYLPRDNLVAWNAQAKRGLVKSAG